MKIGILQAGHSPDELREAQGDYGEIFTSLLDGQGFAFEIFSVVDGAFPAGVEDADGWLITGSKHGAYEDHAWIPPLEDLIRDIYAEGRPLVGVCFGHQIIAQALGGKVEKFSGGWSIGPVEYALEGDKATIMAWHQDQVVDLPPGAEVIGQSDFCRYAALRYDDRIWTVQPHPEFSDAFVEGLIRHRGRGVVPDAQLDAAARALGTPLSTKLLATKMAAFLRREKPMKEAV